LLLKATSVVALWELNPLVPNITYTHHTVWHS